MKNIASALVQAQKAFGPALKSSTNPHFKSRYADLAACVEAVIDALNANGIALVQQTRDCDSGVIVETVFLHESGESLSCGPLHVPAAKNDPQGYGSALTYARRYSLMAACGIAPEDDDGNAASKPKIKQGDGVISATKLAWDALQPEIQDKLRQKAPHVAAAMPDGAKARTIYEMAVDEWPEDVRNDIRAGFWYLLDSATRSAIKRAAA